MQTTVPQPFNLSYADDNQQRKSKVVVEMKQKEMRECTFKPSINRAKNKDIVRDLLQS